MTEKEQENGAATAPEIFHLALDQLYRWMAENDHADGMTTIKAKGEDGELPLCADLSVVIYHENPADEDTGTEPEPA